eukprot:gene7806-7873_t
MAAAGEPWRAFVVTGGLRAAAFLDFAGIIGKARAGFSRARVVVCRHDGTATDHAGCVLRNRPVTLACLCLCPDLPPAPGFHGLGPAGYLPEIHALALQDIHLEAIANVEKLTGMTIPVMTLAGDAGAADRGDDAATDREEAGAERGRGRKHGRGRERGTESVAAEAPKKPRREARGADRKVAVERPADPEAAPAAETAAPPPARRAAPTASPAPKPAAAADDGIWNGPVPGFLQHAMQDRDGAGAGFRAVTR